MFAQFGHSLPIHELTHQSNRATWQHTLQKFTKHGKKLGKLQLSCIRLKYNLRLWPWVAVHSRSTSGTWGRNYPECSILLEKS